MVVACDGIPDRVDLRWWVIMEVDRDCRDGWDGTDDGWDGTDNGWKQDQHSFVFQSEFKL